MLTACIITLKLTVYLTTRGYLVVSYRCPAVTEIRQTHLKTQNYYHPVKTIQTSHMQTREEKKSSSQSWPVLKPRNFVRANLGQRDHYLRRAAAAAHEQLFQLTLHNVWKSEQIRSTHTHMVVWHHAERHAFGKLLYVLSQCGQRSWEELKWSVAPIQCSWFYRCLLSNPDSSPKVHLYMQHMHDMINLPFSGNTRLAVFVLHSLYLCLSDWKIPSWILWP